MKNFNELTLLFPEMEQKRQESILGGAYGTYYGDDRDNQNPGSSQTPGGIRLAEVTIYGTPIPGGTYTGPGFNTGGSNGDGNQQPGDSGYGGTTGQSIIQALHPEIVDRLVNKFGYSLDLNHAVEEKANFKKILTEIDSSATGDKILAALDAHYQQFPNDRVPLVSDAMPPKGGTEAYSPSTKQLYLGNALLDGNLVSQSTYTVAHELYHDYQNVTGQSPLHSNLELDAYLFGAEVVKEMTTKDFRSLDIQKDLESVNPTTQAQKDFNSAWEKYLNGDYSASNYAVLDNNFLNGSQFGSQYKTYNDGTGPKTVTNDPNTLPQFLKDLAFPPSMGDGNNPTPANPYQH